MLRSTSSHNRPKLNSHPNRIIVSLKDKVSDTEGLAFLQEDGFKHLETFDFPEESFPGMTGDLVLIESPDDFTTQQALKELSEDPRVEFAEPDFEHTLDAPKQEQETREPDDLKSSLWGLSNSRDTDIDAPEAWAKTVGSNTTGPIIAVLDTGVDLDHPDLAANLWVNTGEIPNNGKDDDGNGVVDDVHGDHTAVAQLNGGKWPAVAHVAGVLAVHRLGLSQNGRCELFGIVLGTVAQKAGFRIVHGHAVIVGHAIHHRKSGHRRFDAALHELDQIIIGQP